jgi:putative flippase GtrA
MIFNSIHRQFFIFILVGGITSLIDLLVIFLLEFLGFNYIICIFFGYFFSLFINYFLHSKITFKKKQSPHIFLRFLIVIFVNVLLIYFFVEFFVYFGLDYKIAKVISLPFIAANGFFLSKYWTYR